MPNKRFSLCLFSLLLLFHSGYSASVIISPTTNYTFQPSFQGFSYQRFHVNEPLFMDTNLPLVQLFKNIGPGGNLRFLAECEPGYLDIVWDNNASAPAGRPGFVSRADLIRVDGFLKATNWTILYGIKLENSTPSAAVQEVVAATEIFGSRLVGIEIGNEPDAYSKPIYGPPQVPGYTYAEYVVNWTSFSTAIRKAVPSTVFTGPASPVPSWVLNFSKNFGFNASLLTFHYYMLDPNNQPNATVDTLVFGSQQFLFTQITQFNQAADAHGMKLGYRISEANSITVCEHDICNSMGSVMWGIDFLFQTAMYNSTGVNWNSGDQNPYSPIWDVKKGNPPIYEVTNVTSLYYVMLLFSYVTGGTLHLNSYSGPGNVTVYAVVMPSGATRVVVSNKRSDMAVTLNITATHPVAQASYMLLTTTSPGGLSALGGFKFGGSEVSISNGSWDPSSQPRLPVSGSSTEVTIPTASVVLVFLEPSRDPCSNSLVVGCKNSIKVV